MKFKRHFFDTTVNFKKISKERFVLSLAIGFASAFTIYGFFYVLRESFRALSFSFENIPNIISESDRNFYNIFFAGLSLIFGNSIAINLLLSKPQNVLSRRNYKRKRILNDQIFLSFNFSYWFTKIGLVFGVFSMCCLDFQFLLYFKFISYLLLLVLYLESWKNLSTILKKNRFKIQILHFIALVFFTVILSKLDFINYKSIDALSLKNNPIIDLPYSDFYNSENESRDMIIHFKLKLDETGNLIILTEDKRQIFLKDIPSEILMEQASRREELIPFISVRISADKNLDLIYIKKIEAELLSVHQQKLIYDVYNKNMLSRRFESYGIPYRISPNILKLNKNTNTPLPPVPSFKMNMIFSDTLKVEIGKTIRVNENIVSSNMLASKFKNYIDKNIALEYIYLEDAKYQDYITVLASHFKAVYALRKEQTIFIEHEWQSNKPFRNEQNILMEKYPVIIIEAYNFNQ